MIEGIGLLPVSVTLTSGVIGLLAFEGGNACGAGVAPGSIVVSLSGGIPAGTRRWEHLPYESASRTSSYLVIDGHKRIAALQQLGRDTVEATVWAMSAAEALLLERSLRFTRRATTTAAHPSARPAKRR